MVNVSFLFHQGCTLTHRDCDLTGQLTDVWLALPEFYLLQVDMGNIYLQVIYNFFQRVSITAVAIWLQPCLLFHYVAVGPNQMSKHSHEETNVNRFFFFFFLNVKSTDGVWSLETVNVEVM